jgi:pyruvate/2-oxoglutarate dehydrogenase complex dihydrolipoamide acyltransferase (E2) component
MNFRYLAASVRPRARLVALLAATALAVPFVPCAQAQTPPPAAPKKAAPKAAPKAPAPAAQAPAAPGDQAQQQPVPGQQPPADQQIQLIYAPWTKFCLKGQDPNAKQVCFTGKDGRIESGQPVLSPADVHGNRILLFPGIWFKPKDRWFQFASPRLGNMTDDR